MLRGLYSVVMGFASSLVSMFWVLCLLIVGLFICAMFTTVLIGQDEDLQSIDVDGFTMKERFGTITRSTYSLFELMTLEGWTSVARPIVTKEPWLMAFFVLFICVFTFGLLNMFVGMVVGKTMEQAKIDEADEQREKHARMVNALL